MTENNIDELLILVANIERLLKAANPHAERQQLHEIVEHMERTARDGSITALANDVAIAISQRRIDGEFGSVAVHRAFRALERLRASLREKQTEHSLAA